MSDQTNKLKSDLIIVFGFSGKTADKTITKYINRTLTITEQSRITYIKNSPLFNSLGHRFFDDDFIDDMNKLNYRLSNG